jgi:hypothetical protein
MAPTACLMSAVGLREAADAMMEMARNAKAPR